KPRRHSAQNIRTLRASCSCAPSDRSTPHLRWPRFVRSLPSPLPGTRCSLVLSISFSTLLTRPHQFDGAETIAAKLLITVCSQHPPVDAVTYKYATAGTVTLPEKTCAPSIVTVICPLTMDT